MKAEAIKLRKILEGQCRYIVPLFQRPYSWSSKNWEALWNDFTDLYQQEDRDELSHFLGSIVTQEIPCSPNEVTSYIIIDGQQRLTTLSILIAALRDHARETEKVNKIIVDELHDFLINRYGKGDDIYKVFPTQSDRSCYTLMVKQEASLSSGLIKEAYLYFRDSIQSFEKDPGSDFEINTFKNLILSSLNLVRVSLDKDDDPYLIYEGLNYKGEPLSQADLIRNYIFMRLPQKIHNNAYKNIWLPIEKRFKKEENAGNNYLKEMTYSFWYYLRKYGTPVNQKFIYQSYKKHTDKVPESQIIDELKNLMRFSDFYLSIHYPKNEESNKDLQYWFSHFQELNLTSFYPFVLNAYSDYHQGYITSNEFSEILKSLESYAFRRWICGIPSSPLNKTFIALYPQLKKQNPVIKPNILRAKLASFDRTQAWPDDFVFKKAIIERPVYGHSQEAEKRIKFFFRRIQESFSKEIVDFSNLTVEHILPQKPKDCWFDTLEDSSMESHRKWVDNLGNLTMTSENSEMSNKSFQKKLEFLRNSNLSLNRYFDKIRDWNYTEIEKRGSYLADLAIKVWPR
jgi:uncharacterized protein with ParB-like and HNH nuclease domain